jgi:chemotaxis protein methyltransferase CheR
MAIYALAAATGLELTEYRPDHVEECLRRAIEREGTADVHELARLLRSDDRAASRFRCSLAVSVTGLFRDPQQFDVLDPWLERLPSRSHAGVSVWSAGCANGAELLSAGMLLERRGLLEGARLLGSDVLEENLAAARAGGPDPDVVPDAVRRLARWERRDLVRDDAAPGHWSLVLCRNVAIYFTARARDALHARLAGALAPGGLLLLGRSETLTTPGRLGLESVGPHLFRRAA